MKAFKVQNAACGMNSMQVFNRICKYIKHNKDKNLCSLSSFLYTSYFSCLAKIIVTYKHICFFSVCHTHTYCTHKHTQPSTCTQSPTISLLLLYFLMKDCWSIKAPLIIRNCKKALYVICITCFCTGGFRSLLWQQSCINIY